MPSASISSKLRDDGSRRTSSSHRSETTSSARDQRSPSASRSKKIKASPARNPDVQPLSPYTTPGSPRIYDDIDGAILAGAAGAINQINSAASPYIPESLDTDTYPSVSVDEGLEQPNDGDETDIETDLSHIPGSHTASPSDGFNYVTQPPVVKPTGLTGKISTLFRTRPSTKHNKDKHQHRDNHKSSSSSRRKQHDLFASETESNASGAPQENDDGSRDQSFDVPSQAGSRASKRLFYSSNADDDSDDSYESRLSRASKVSNLKGALSASTMGQSGTNTSRDSASVENDKNRRGRNADDDSDSDDSDSDDDGQKTILRYRGFSTSIQSLFLDEPLVCAAMGCFGLILSNRTEYLLQLRNERRGTLSPNSRSSRSSSNSSLMDRRKLPSRVVAYGLTFTILMMFLSFLIWGFGTGHGIAQGYYEGYDYNNDAVSSNSNGDDDAKGYDDYYAAPDDDKYNNKNNDDGDDQYLDDKYNKNYYGKNYYYNNDDGNNNDDDANDDQYNNDDGNNAAAYDDAYYNNDDGNNAADDGNNNYDDAYNYNNNDDADNGDDGAQAANDDGDDYYKADDDYYRQRHLYQRQRRNNRESVVVPVNTHHLHGIFKLRDTQEYLWNPVWDAFQKEWNRTAIQYQQLTQKQQLQQSYAKKQQQLQGLRFLDQDEQNNSTFYEAAHEKQEQDIGSHIRIALLFAFLLFLGILGRRRRMRTRFHLVKARAQEDHLFYASSEVGSTRRVAFQDTREDQYEGACSHTLCGCYPVDDVIASEEKNAEVVKVTDNGIFGRKRKRLHEDVVARGFRCFMTVCCGAICKCWFQCLSVCALAQEAREIRLLVPPRYQRIDFITHQPFHEYQKSVNEIRRGWMGRGSRMSGIMPHYHALSRLSRYISLTGILVVTAIVVTLIFNPRAAFSWQDAVVLIATFAQSFLVLFFVHGIFHKSDLSLDAVIKLFAAGFLIAVPTAFFFEGLLVNVVLFGAWGVFEIFVALLGDDFTTWVFQHWRLIWILGELFNAYVVAAITEEMCKYYTFRAVEHPDLMFLTGLHRDEQDDTAVDGGVIKYPFGSHQIQELNKADETSTRSGSRDRRLRKKLGSKEEKLLDTEEFQDEEEDVRTHRQKAMAITTGMISVAVGLACAENFLYVFVLGGALGNDTGEDRHKGDIIEAWIVLFFRSIFPIHALAAALQSIDMIRKFVETSNHNGHRIGVGRIIFPAVMVHGSFDAVLMGINVYVETAWDKYLEENEGNIGEDPPYDSLTVNLVAWISITVIMFAGIFWYWCQNRSQRLRLIEMEQQEKEDAGLPGRTRKLRDPRKNRNKTKEIV